MSTETSLEPPVMADTPYSKFAQERSHNDAKGLAEFGKTLIQMLIGINGLAATGSITLAAATKETAITLAVKFVYAIGCYLFGVFCGIVSSILLYTGAQYWTIAWEQNAYSNVTLAKRYGKKGYLFNLGTLAMSTFGLGAFVVGGFLAVWAILSYQAGPTH